MWCLRDETNTDSGSYPSHSSKSLFLIDVHVSVWLALCYGSWVLGAAFPSGTGFLFIFYILARINCEQNGRATMSWSAIHFFILLYLSLGTCWPCHMYVCYAPLVSGAAPSAPSFHHGIHHSAVTHRHTYTSVYMS